MYLFLVANGWEKTLEKYRPSHTRQADPTIGQFIKAVSVTRPSAVSPKTFTNYVAALRKITADIVGIAGDASKHGHGQVREDWLEQVHKVKLSVLTPKAIDEWRRKFLNRAQSDPIHQRSARVSINSFIRNARSLFGADMIKHLEMELPSPLPFAGVKLEAGQNTKYQKTFDVGELVSVANIELAPTHPEEFKALILAVAVGLRRHEIDLLEWSSFRWDDGTIQIQPTQHFAAKNESSYGTVAVALHS